MTDPHRPPARLVRPLTWLVLLLSVRAIAAWPGRSP